MQTFLIEQFILISAIALMLFMGSGEAWVSLWQQFYLNNKINAIELKRDIHFYYSILRTLVAIPIIVYMNWKCFIGLGFMFPFFHDGSFYVTSSRWYANYRIKGWWSMSENSSSFYTKYLTPQVRITGLVLGLGFYWFHWICIAIQYLLN
jgi:hypothetical protein